MVGLDGDRRLGRSVGFRFGHSLLVAIRPWNMQAFRDLERAYADSHLTRLAGNTVESIETSSLHLDLISDLKRINSHICSIAYPILEEAGVLARTRLKEPDPVIDDDPVPTKGVRNGKDGWQKRKPRTA